MSLPGDLTAIAHRRWTGRDLMRPPIVRAVLMLALLATAALLVASAYVKPNTFTTLDWAINYEGGFVRRGLVGAILLPLSEATGVDVLDLVVALNVALYGTFLAAIYLVLRRLAFPVAAVLLVYSPFFLVYQISSWPSAGRKEIAFLAAFAVLCGALGRTRSPRGDTIALGAFLAVLPALVLIHEAHLFYGAWAFALALALEVGRANMARLAAASVPTGIAFGAVLLFPGTDAKVQAICQSLQGTLGSPRLEADCATTDTAVIWLSRDTADGFGFVADLLPLLLPALPPAVLLMSLAFLPLLPALRQLPARTRRALAVGGGLAATASLPLFVVAIDWGRFLYVQAVCLALTVLVVLSRRLERIEAKGWEPALWMVLVYGLFWSVQYKPPLIGGGYLIDYAFRLARGLE